MEDKREMGVPPFFNSYFRITDQSWSVILVGTLSVDRLTKNRPTLVGFFLKKN